MKDTAPERLKKTYQTQLEKYGGVEGYAAEMRRRRSLVTTKSGFAMMTPEQRRRAQLKSVKARKQNAKNRAQAEKAAESDNQEANQG